MTRPKTWVANIAGFFVEEYDNDNDLVIGRLMTILGLKTEG